MAISFNNLMKLLVKKVTQVKSRISISKAAQSESNENTNGRQQNEVVERTKAELQLLQERFLVGDGKLPSSFSFFTPFEPYLSRIGNKVDHINERSGYSAWLLLSDTADIHAAISDIIEWKVQNNKICILISQKSHIGDAYIEVPPHIPFYGSIMIVLEDRNVFHQVTEEEIDRCRENRVSFCTLLDSHSLYELIEKKAKAVKYIKYLGFHDDTAIYCDWYLEWIPDEPCKKDNLAAQDETSARVNAALDHVKRLRQKAEAALEHGDGTNKVWKYKMQLDSLVNDYIPSKSVYAAQIKISDTLLYHMYPIEWGEHRIALEIAGDYYVLKETFARERAGEGFEEMYFDSEERAIVAWLKHIRWTPKKRASLKRLMAKQQQFMQELVSYIDKA